MPTNMEDGSEEMPGMPPVEAMAGNVEPAGATLLLDPAMITGLDKLKPGQTGKVELTVKVAGQGNSDAGGEFSQGTEVEVVSGRVLNNVTTPMNAGKGTVPAEGF